MDQRHSTVGRRNYDLHTADPGFHPTHHIVFRILPEVIPEHPAQSKPQAQHTQSISEAVGGVKKYVEILSSLNPLRIETVGG